MSGLEASTSSGCRIPPAAVTPVFVLLLGTTLCGAGTVSAALNSPSVKVVSETSSGSPVWRRVDGATDGRQQLHELRRTSGLTWDQLARTFGVSRRAVHLWASGRPMSSLNEERLQRVLAFVRQRDRGSAAANRATLTSVLPNGRLTLEAIASGAWLATPFSEPAKIRRRPGPISRSARLARRPISLDVAVGGVNEPGAQESRAPASPGMKTVSPKGEGQGED